MKLDWTTILVRFLLGAALSTLVLGLTEKQPLYFLATVTSVLGVISTVVGMSAAQKDAEKRLKKKRKKKE